MDGQGASLVLGIKGEIALVLWCEECGENLACYKGETVRNSYTRGLEHLDNLAAKSEDKSVLWLHPVYQHRRREDVQCSMRVTESYSLDSVDRQVMKKVIGAKPNLYCEAIELVWSGSP